MKSIIFLLVGLICGSFITAAFATKYESYSSDAGSILGYGYNGATLVPIQVDASGVLQTN